MKIENVIFQFHPQSPFEKLQLTPLEQQYLADLRGQNTIQQIVETYLKNGWLVNFQAFYQLIKMLVTNHWVLNPEINSYFAQLKIKNEDFSKAAASREKTNSVYKKEDLLKLPFFRSLNAKLSEYLISHASVYKYPVESLICKAGDTTRDLFVLLKGQAAVYRQQDGFRQFVAVLSEESVFGESGFLLGKPRTADVVTLKASEILVVPYHAETLDHYLQKEKAQDVLKRFWVQHALLNSETFKNFPSDCLDALTFAGKIINLQDQQMLFKEGDPSEKVYVVIQGTLAIQQKGRTIATLAQGAFLGEISIMLNDGKRTASVFGQKNTVLLEIHRNEFYKLLSQNLYLAQSLQALAEQRLQKDTQRS